MALITLEEAKAYLRVDSDYEDSLIASLLSSAESVCRDVARLDTDVWDEIAAYTETMRRTITIREEPIAKQEVLHLKELLKVAVFYALGYLYEHREEADHRDMVLTLRNLLYSVREGVF